MWLLYGINNSNLPDSIQWNVTYLTLLQPDSVKRNLPDAGPTWRSMSETRAKDLSSPPQEGLYTSWVLIVSRALTISTLDGSHSTTPWMTSTWHRQLGDNDTFLFLLSISFFLFQDSGHMHQNIDGSWLQPWVVTTTWYERPLPSHHRRQCQWIAMRVISVDNILYKLDGWPRCHSSQILSRYQCARGMLLFHDLWAWHMYMLNLCC